MSIEESHRHLHEFMSVEKRAIESMENLAKQDGITIDYAFDELPNVLKWLSTRMTINRIPLSDTESKWIRDAHPDGRIEFPEESKYVILRAAFYMGECFARKYNTLKWGIGNIEHIHKNQPVVVGFIGIKELPVLMVCQNTFNKVLCGDAPATRFDEVIQFWNDRAG